MRSVGSLTVTIDLYDDRYNPLHHAATPDCIMEDEALTVEAMFFPRQDHQNDQQRPASCPRADVKPSQIFSMRSTARKATVASGYTKRIVSSNSAL